MSKRNFILLIIIILVAIIAVFGYFYFNPKATIPGIENTNGTNFISQFNPFGNSTTRPPTGTTSPDDISGDQPPEEEGLRLRKVSSMPIAGFTVFSKERLIEIPVVAPEPEVAPSTDPSTAPESSASPVTTTKKTSKPTPPPTEFMSALRYVERATGNIYQTFADKIEERRFSETMIPMIYEAFFGNKGDSVVMRYLKADAKTIITFVGTLPKESLGADTAGSNEIKGVFLPENVKDLSVSSDTSNVFYLFTTGTNLENSIVGTTLNFLTNKKIQVFDSTFTEWLSLFPNNKMITLTTKASSGIPGYVYMLDPNNKNYNFHKVLGGINGLTSLTSPDGKSILYSNDNLSLNIYHTDTKISNTLGVRTLAEKCVWNKSGNVVYCGVPKSFPSTQYPDSWYQGEVSFLDQIWKIDITTGNATMIADPVVKSGEEIDSIKLAIDDEENYLFFVNKKDSFLWELELK